MKKSTPKEVFETYRKRFSYFPEYEINAVPNSHLKFSIVIPCYNEPALLKTLDSLLQCDTPSTSFEVLVVVNNAVDASKEITVVNLKTINDFKNWKKSANSHLVFHCVEALNLPSKKAGVGLARKIGMDLAANRFAALDKTGWIINLDADCEVSTNYLTEIERCITNNIRGGHFFFKHKIDNVKEEVLKQGIALYELHLRYYSQALKFSGFKYWYHTVGSCMIARSDVYALQGGMNQRKAGEDFYFMHKIMPGGNMLTINQATVYPSARISNRVPFGTGKAQGDWVDGGNKIRLTYHFKLFSTLRMFFSTLCDWYREVPKLDDVTHSFLVSVNFEEVVSRIKKRSSTQDLFIKNITQYCDGFFTLKFVHYLRDRQYGEGDVISEANALLSELKGATVKRSTLELLHAYRELDKNSE